MEGRSGRFLNLIGHIGNETRQIQYHCLDIQGVAFLQATGLLIVSPDNSLTNEAALVLESKDEATLYTSIPLFKRMSF